MSDDTPKGYLTPWVEKIPNEWKKSRIDSVADVIFSNVDKHTFDDETSVRLCNYTDVYKNDKITGAIDFMEASADLREVEKFQIRQGDLLVTKDSETPDDIAISALVMEELQGVLCGYHLAMIRPRSKRVCSPFLFWLHASKQFRAQYEARAVGVTRFGLPQYVFRSATIPLPPLTEQERIAAYLDASCAAIDEAIASKRHQLEFLDLLRKSIIHLAVTQGINTNIELRDSEESWLGKVPAHWTRSRIRNVAMLSPWYSQQPPSKHEECTIVPMELLSNDGLIDVSNQIPLGDVQPGLTLFEEGDVIFAKITPCMENGKGAFVNYLPTRYGFGSTEFHVLRPSCLVLGKFLYYVTWNSIYRAYAAENMTGAAGQKRVSSRFLKDTRLFLPSLFEQKTICSFLDTKIAELKRITTCIEQQITTFLAYRKSLIHECVTGQRRVTEEDVRRVVKGKSGIEGAA